MWIVCLEDYSHEMPSLTFSEKKKKKKNQNAIYCICHRCFNPCPAEEIKLTHPLQISSQSDYLIQIDDINSHTEWQFAIGKQCRSRSAGFLEKAGYIQAQQDKG